MEGNFVTIALRRECLAWNFQITFRTTIYQNTPLVAVLLSMLKIIKKIFH